MVPDIRVDVQAIVLVGLEVDQLPQHGPKDDAEDDDCLIPKGLHCVAYSPTVAAPSVPNNFEFLWHNLLDVNMYFCKDLIRCAFNCDGMRSADITIRAGTKMI